MIHQTIRTMAAAVVLFGVIAGSASSVSATDFKLDPTHTAIVFKVAHLGMSETYGRFNEVEGNITHVEGDISKCAFSFTVKAASVDTGLKKRDDHLRGPDFFNVKQFPVITFNSTAISQTDQGLEVTGDLALHGVTKSITINLTKNGEGQDPWGNYRVGYSTSFEIKRSDYAMDQMTEAVGDEVGLMISFEGIRQ